MQTTRRAPDPPSVTRRPRRVSDRDERRQSGFVTGRDPRHLKARDLVLTSNIMRTADNIQQQPARYPGDPSDQGALCDVPPGGAHRRDWGGCHSLPEGMGRVSQPREPGPAGLRTAGLRAAGHRPGGARSRAPAGPGAVIHISTGPLIHTYWGF